LYNAKFVRVGALRVTFVLPENTFCPCTGRLTAAIC